MEERNGSLRGDLVKWAREEQRLTMRWVADNGGPCLGYQSEVENQKKAEVRWDKLTTWIRALNITEPFVRGQIPRYCDEPKACRGLASDIGRRILEGQHADYHWVSMSCSERARVVLQLIVRESQKLPRIVLAYVLSLELVALDAMLDGRLPITAINLRALAEITSLPESFFVHGVLEAVPDGLSDYAQAVEAARRRGISPVELLRIINMLDEPLGALLRKERASW